jgi:group I intron endonuclease
MIIYLIINKVNGKKYIGQTARSFQERMKEHISHSTQLIDRKIREYGIDSFECKVIDQANSIEELNQKEINWINKENSLMPNGYNLCIGGDNTLGYNHRLESKKKMSQAQIKRNMKGQKNPYYGKKHSKETREKMKKAWENREPNTQALVPTWTSNKKRVVNIDTQEVFESVKEAAQKYSLKATHISRVCRGKRKSTGGFKWMYLDDCNDNTVPS